MAFPLSATSMEVQPRETLLGGICRPAWSLIRDGFQRLSNILAPLSTEYCLKSPRVRPILMLWFFLTRMTDFTYGIIYAAEPFENILYYLSIYLIYLYPVKTFKTPACWLRLIWQPDSGLFIFLRGFGRPYDRSFFFNATSLGLKVPRSFSTCRCHLCLTANHSADFYYVVVHIQWARRKAAKRIAVISTWDVLRVLFCFPLRKNQQLFKKSVWKSGGKKHPSLLRNIIVVAFSQVTFCPQISKLHSRKVAYAPVFDTLEQETNTTKASG